MEYKKPTDSEMEILQILWQNGPSTVRFINDILNERRDVGYTTTLKLLQIMNDKGIAVRDTDSKTHIYSAAIIESDTKNHMITDFVNNIFHGSAMDLVMQTLGNSTATDSEIEELKAIIQQLESYNNNIE